MLNNQQPPAIHVNNLFWEIAPRMILALSAATGAPAVAFTVFLVFYFAVGALSDPTPHDFVEIIAGAGYITLVALFMGFAALIVSSLYIIFLGLPASIIGWWLRLIRWWSCIIIGFILGGFPLALLELSRGEGSYTTVGNVPLKIDGVLTHEGWIDLAQKVGLMGLLGAIGGFAFWLVWRSSDSSREGNVID